MKKILIVPLLGLGYEGITSVIYNYSNNLDKKTDLKLDFITFNETNQEIIDRFEKIGKIYTIHKRNKDTMKYLKEIFLILLRNKYDVIHIHGNSGTMLMETLLAKMVRIKKIIVHCHSTKCNYPTLNKILTPMMKMIATNFIACSNDAGKWLYKENYLVLNNAIDLNKFKFNKFTREEYRRKLGIKDEFVIGHIGHFTNVKNHEFLIEVFKEVCKMHSKTKLLLVSDGPLLETIKNKVYELDLQDSVIFLGRRNDVDKLYQVMDCFVFPSKWEGLGMVLIEAQASGLPCFASKAVPKEANVTGLVKYLSLEETSRTWAIKILETNINLRHMIKDNVIEEIRDSGYDIKNNVDVLKKIYME